jgi:hypothetical protein
VARPDLIKDEPLPPAVDAATLAAANAHAEDPAFIREAVRRLVEMLGGATLSEARREALK